MQLSTFFDLFLFPSVALFALVYAVFHPNFRSFLQCIVLNSNPLKCFQSPFAQYFHIWGRPRFSISQVINGDIKQYT